MTSLRRSLADEGVYRCGTMIMWMCVAVQHRTVVRYIAMSLHGFTLLCTGGECNMLLMVLPLTTITVKPNYYGQQ